MATLVLFQVPTNTVPKPPRPRMFEEFQLLVAISSSLYGTHGVQASAANEAADKSKKDGNQVMINQMTSCAKLINLQFFKIILN